MAGQHSLLTALVVRYKSVRQVIHFHSWIVERAYSLSTVRKNISAAVDKTLSSGIVIIWVQRSDEELDLSSRADRCFVISTTVQNGNRQHPWLLKILSFESLNGLNTGFNRVSRKLVRLNPSPQISHMEKAPYRQGAFSLQLLSAGSAAASSRYHSITACNQSSCNCNHWQIV